MDVECGAGRAGVVVQIMVERAVLIGSALAMWVSLYLLLGMYGPRSRSAPRTTDLDRLIDRAVAVENRRAQRWAEERPSGRRRSPRVVDTASHPPSSVRRVDSSSDDVRNGLPERSGQGRDARRRVLYDRAVVDAYDALVIAGYPPGQPVTYLEVSRRSGVGPGDVRRLLEALGPR